MIHAYLHGGATDEMLQRFGGGGQTIWYYQDAQGNTTHLADDLGDIKERYKYDPAFSGAPLFFNGSGQEIFYSYYDNRFLYNGRDWLKEIELYDYRNRFYLPSLGRFMQPDPIGFAGDPSNLYRYCGGDPVNNTDPTGLVTSNSIKKKDGNTNNNNPNSVTWTSNYTPTGSNIPQSRTATWNGSTWDISYHDAVNGTHEAGSFALISGGGFSNDRGGASFVPAASVAATVAIERGPFAGTKAIQQIFVTPSGAITVGTTYTGSTGIIPGLFFPSQSGNGTSVTLNGTAFSLPLMGITAYSMSIDYSFKVAVNFSQHTASVTGSHDGYPSYYVAVGNSLIYHWTERSFWDLRPPMEVPVEASGHW